MSLSYIFVQSHDTDCILHWLYVIRHPDDGHSSGRNMVAKNNIMWLSIFLNAQLLAYHGSIKHSLMLVYGTQNTVLLFYYMWCSVYVVSLLVLHHSPH